MLVSEGLGSQLIDWWPASACVQGKEMTQNMFMVRFANNFLNPAWDRNHIANVQASGAMIHSLAAARCCSRCTPRLATALA